MADYYLTLTKHMYLQQMLADAYILGQEDQGEDAKRPSTLTVVIVSDNARSPAAPKSTAVQSTRSKYSRGRKSVVRKRRRSRRSKQFNQTLAKLEEVSRWQSILLSKAQIQAQEAKQEEESATTTTTNTANAMETRTRSLMARSAAAPERPRRRRSVECRPRYPRRQLSIVGAEQGLDSDSNHSQIAANAA